VARFYQVFGAGVRGGAQNEHLRRDGIRSSSDTFSAPNRSGDAGRKIRVMDLQIAGERA
jgi:hypothetical protein